MLNRFLLSLLSILLVGTGLLWANTYRELQHLRSAHSLLYPDTVRVPFIPKELEEEVTRLRSENVSLKERLAGIKVIPPEKGKGPVVTYDEPVPTDTAIAMLRVHRGNLHTLLQIPDSVDPHQSRWVQLPVKDIARCRSFSVGGNGMTRCQRPPFGILDLFAEASLAVTNTEPLQLDDRAGLSWKRDAASRLEILAWVRPREPFQIYVGGRYSYNLFGR